MKVASKLVPMYAVSAMRHVRAKGNSQPKTQDRHCAQECDGFGVA